ncbi:MAG: hypothetical protein OXE83_08500 [Gammaproteobacteria bacterium]|nr:hypothetical protein [Gammaproteobacteria bacterium]
MSEDREQPPLDVARLAGAKARGKRPYFLENPDAERVLSIAMAIAGELAVLRQRLDTIEELLESRGSLTRAEIEAFVPSPAHAQERGRWQQEYLARILRILQQEAEAQQRGEEPTSAEAGARMLGE